MYERSKNFPSVFENMYANYISQCFCKCKCCQISLFSACVTKEHENVERGHAGSSAVHYKFYLKH